MEQDLPLEKRPIMKGTAAKRAREGILVLVRIRYLFQMLQILHHPVFSWNTSSFSFRFGRVQKPSLRQRSIVIDTRTSFRRTLLPVLLPSHLQQARSFSRNAPPARYLTSGQDLQKAEHFCQKCLFAVSEARIRIWEFSNAAFCSTSLAISTVRRLKFTLNQYF